MNCKHFCHTVVAAAPMVPITAAAHDGHSNTPLHALLHMLEANGVWIGLLLVAGIGSLAYRAHKARVDRGIGSQKAGDDHDAR